METLEITWQGYDSKMAELYDVLAGQGRQSDAASLVEDEARLFLKQVISFTPPKNRAQGENKVKGDVGKLFSPVEESYAEYVANGGYRVHPQSTGNENIDLWLHNHVTGTSYEVKWDKLDVRGEGMSEYHAKSRDINGRVSGRRKWGFKYIVGDNAFASYLKKVQARVGMMKAGWVFSFYEVGGKVQNWIERHLSNKSLGKCFNDLSIPGEPSITIHNSAPGIMSQERIVLQAFRARRESMTRRIKLIVSGYGKDIASGQKPHKKATWAKAAFAE